MPNWCLNKLTVKHHDASMLDRFVAAYDKDKACQEFLPKPEDIGEGWWEWCCNNWGTKWDIGAGEFGDKAVVENNTATCKFSSAWSPPVGLYNKLVELGYDVEASYFEPGMGFCGLYKNGEDHYAECGTKEMIPQQIWQDFDLSDQYF